MPVVKVKWGKETFPVEVDTTSEVMLFKAQLFGLTNVPVDGMKIMIKGKMLKDDSDLSKVGLTSGMTIMMMGTASDKGLKEPTEKIVFYEDMTPKEKAIAMNKTEKLVAPPGLANLGNTCYMASCL